VLPEQLQQHQAQQQHWLPGTALVQLLQLRHLVLPAPGACSSWWAGTAHSLLLLLLVVLPLLVLPHPCGALLLIWTGLLLTVCTSQQGPSTPPGGGQL
jgi:hypothetical protein